MSNQPTKSWTSSLLSRLGVATAAFEDKPSRSVSKLALAAALSLSLGSGTVMANEHADTSMAPEITGAYLASMVLDTEKKALDILKQYRPEASSTHIAQQSTLHALGMNKTQLSEAPYYKPLSYGIKTLDFALNPHMALVENSSMALASSLVGASTGEIERGAFAGKMASTLITVTAAGPALAVPAALAGAVNVYKHYQWEGEKKTARAMDEVNERTRRVGLEHKFDLQLADRDKRAAASPQDQEQYTNWMSKRAVEYSIEGQIPDFLRERMVLEEMIQQAGGEVEPWYTQYQRELQDHYDKTWVSDDPDDNWTPEDNVEPADMDGFIGKAINLQGKDVSLASSNRVFEQFKQHAQKVKQDDGPQLMT